MTEEKNLSIILPTLNEEENLKKLIPEIAYLLEAELKISYEIIVVDDGSTDNTKELLERLNKNNESIRIINRSTPKSLPLSILDGIHSSRFSNVMWLDADGSMPVVAMEKLLKKYFSYANREKAIIGSRFIEGGGYKGVKDVKNQSIISSIRNVRESNDSVFGMILSIIINKFLSVLFRSKLTDLTSGFIVLNKEHIDDEVFINKEYGEYFIYLIGSLINKNIEIEEVGYVCETRMHGYSKTGSGIIKFMIRGVPYIYAALRKGLKNENL